MHVADFITRHGRATQKPADAPFVIAEAGVNHAGSLDLAFRLIDEAKEGAADAIKFQTYKAETLASVHSPSYWDTTKEPTRSQYELFKKYDTFCKSDYEALKRRCDDVGIEFLSTPFDTESAIFLNDLMGAFKISSSDITNRPFIELISSFQKPILLSTGASYLYEVEEALHWMAPSGVDVVLLHCVLNYPTPDEHAHLAVITELRERFPRHVVGYSDHTLPEDMSTLEIAWLLGASILEKHFTHDKSLVGNDHYHAMDKEDLKRFVAAVGRAQKLLGSQVKTVLPNECIARENARRSVVMARDVSRGQRLCAEDLTWKRPGKGIDPRFFHAVVGMVAQADLKADDVLTWGRVASE
jgi:sialic acid synthase SpsE